MHSRSVVPSRSTAPARPPARRKAEAARRQRRLHDGVRAAGRLRARGGSAVRSARFATVAPSSIVSEQQGTPYAQRDASGSANAS